MSCHIIIYTGFYCSLAIYNYLDFPVHFTAALRGGGAREVHSSTPPRIWQIHLYCYNSDDFAPPTFLNCPIFPLIQNPGCSPAFAKVIKQQFRKVLPPKNTAKCTN